jgi:hypothetical protein
MEIGLRDYYIKLDNILPANADCIGYKCISATSGKELLERARIWFHIRADLSQLQLWSAGTFLHSARVDHLAVIPLEHEFLSLRITPPPRVPRTIV